MKRISSALVISDVKIWKISQPQFYERYNHTSTHAHKEKLDNNKYNWIPCINASMSPRTIFFFVLVIRFGSENIPWYKSRTINIMDKSPNMRSLNNTVCTYTLFTKLSQSFHVVYYVQPIVMVYTTQTLCYIPCYWDSACSVICPL